MGSFSSTGGSSTINVGGFTLIIIKRRGKKATVKKRWTEVERFVKLNEYRVIKNVSLIKI